MICQNEQREAGKAYPRTCPRCGLGPCNSDWLSKVKPLAIVQVAIRTDDRIWTLPKPNRHSDVMREIYGSGVTRNYETEKQGFLDSEGNFLNRIEAMRIAEANDQLSRKPGAGYYQGSELFSEDLW